LKYYRNGPAIGLFSAALIGSQISLMQALAQAQWSHFAHMIIAVAMLGFGVSGTWLALAGSSLLKRAAIWVPLGMAAAAAALTLAPFLAALPGIGFDMMELFITGGSPLKLVFTYLAFFMPFFFGALAIGLAFAATPERIGALYAWNLAGSALGGPITLLLLTFISASQAGAFLALVAWAAAGIAGLLQRKQVAGVLLGLVCLVGLIRPPQFQPSVYKDLSRALDMPDRMVKGPFPSPYGEVHVVESPALRYAPALSLKFRGTPPSAPVVFVNGNQYGVLLPPKDPGNQHITDATPAGLAYALKKPHRVLVLRAGAGVAVTHALAHDSREIIAVESHPIVRGMAAANTALHANGDKVKWVAGTSRAWLSKKAAAHEANGYDLIVLPAVGGFGGDSGLRALEEDYTLTVEAISEMWSRLNPGGMISAVAWIDYPPRASLRLAALLADVLVRQGLNNPRKHVVILRNWAQMVVVISRNSFQPEQVESAVTFADRLGFDLVGDNLEPTATKAQSYHNLDDDTLVVGLRKILAQKQSQLARKYPFAIFSPSDNRPYFKHFLTLQHWQAYRDLFLENQSPFVEIGLPTLILTFLQIAAISLILIALPLLRLRRVARGFGKPLFYFLAVGCGFMFWEIIMIQRFILYWGHPLMAVAGVIAVLLLGMGAGSLYSSRLKNFRVQACRVNAVLAGLLFAYILILPAFFKLTIGFPLTLRALLGGLILLPPAFLMGFPFPLGLRWVEEPNRARIAWAWGLDGFASVVSASGATILAVVFGFTAPLAMAVAAYGLAALMAGTGARPTSRCGRIRDSQ